MQDFLAYLKKERIALGIIVILTVLMELFVFNFRHFESLGNQPLVLENPVVSEDLLPLGDNTYQRVGDVMTMDFSGINRPVKNIYYGVTNASSSANDIYINLSITDGAHKYLYQLPTNRVLGVLEETKYFRLYLYGETPELRLTFSGIDDGHAIQVSQIVVNAKVPLFLSVSRAGAVFCLLLGLWFCRPGSALYKTRLGRRQPISRWGLAVVVLVVAAHLLLLWKVSRLNPALVGAPGTTMYVDLARSLAAGRFDLFEQVPEKLLQASNPYDNYLRVVEEIPARWDTSMFNGHYYVYFGIVPVLLLYLPYYLLTGMDMPDYAANWFFAGLFVVAAFFLVYQIIRKRFEKIPFLTYLLLALFVFYGSGIIFNLPIPKIYAIPVMAGASLCMLAYGFWLLGMDGDRMRWPFLLLGSASMALVAGSRPPLLLAGACAIPLFWPYLVKKRQLFSKQGVANTVALAAPFVLFGGFLMYYNYARFGSPFSFGHEYLLTTTAIYIRGFQPIALGRALFYFFFQPPQFTGFFPYLQQSSYYAAYMGDAFVEPTFGGVLASTPMLYALPLAVYFRRQLREKKLLHYMLLMLGVGVVLGWIGMFQAGMTQRYMGDFSFLLALAGVLLLLFLTERFDGQPKEKLLRGFILFGLAASMVYCFCLVFVVPEAPFPSVKEVNPVLFYKLLRRIQFWM